MAPKSISYALKNTEIDMTKADKMIAALIGALDDIRREADKPECSRHYISGMASQAIANCDAQRERNSDGYMVVKASR